MLNVGEIEIQVWILTDNVEVDGMAYRWGGGNLTFIDSGILSLWIPYPESPFFGVWGV